MARLSSKLLVLVCMLAVSQCKADTKEAKVDNEESKVDTGEENAEIEKVRALQADWLTFFNNNEVQKSAALYSDDSVYMPQGGPAVTGPEGAFKSLTFVKTFGPKSLTTQKGNGIFHQLGEHTIVSTRYGFTEFPDTNERTNCKGLTVWVKRDGEWKMFRDVFNTDL